MAATFPGAVWTRYATKVDTVSYATASDFNDLADEVVAVETFLVSTTRTENTVFAGPVSAPAAAAAFRALVAADLPAATESAQGALEIATSAETHTGTDDVRAITPLKLATEAPATPAADYIVRLDSSGNLVLPDAGRVLSTVTGADVIHAFRAYSATEAHEQEIAFQKSHQNSVGWTATITAEELGELAWYGCDGTGFTAGAYIRAIQNGAAGTYTPADIVFYTSPGSGAPAEACRISKDGHLVMAASHDINLANGRSVGIDSSNERIEFYTAGYVAVMGARLGVGIATPLANIHAYTADYAALRIERSATSIGSWDFGLTAAWGGGVGTLAIKPGVATADFNIVDTSNNVKFYVDVSDGAVGIGSDAIPSANGSKVLFFGDNTADPTMASNTAGFYGKDVAGTVEAFAVDEGGTAAQLTAHNFAGPVQPLPGTLHWSSYHRNAYMGVEKWYDIERALLALEALTGETFIHTRQIPFSERLNWEQEQAKQLQKALASGKTYKMKSRPFWM